MNYIDMIQKTINFIEDNLGQNLTIENLAASIYCSKFHYHRLFLAIVGEPVMKYIRMRRLALATQLLKETKKKIVDIALEIGFNSHVSFSRCFKTVYGITPEDYRQNGVAIPLFEKVNLQGRHLDNDYRAYLTGPKIVYKDSFNVVGMVLKCSFDENLQTNFVPNFLE